MEGRSDRFSSSSAARVLEAARLCVCVLVPLSRQGVKGAGRRPKRPHVLRSAPQGLGGHLYSTQ